MASKKITISEWIEFFGSGVPPVDWYYALTNKKPAVEKKMFPQFCLRRQRNIVIATAEHVIYLIIGFFAIRLVGLGYATITAIVCIGGIIPVEFYIFRKFKRKLFKNMKSKPLAVTALWNMFNVSLYWVVGNIIGALV